MEGMATRMIAPASERCGSLTGRRVLREVGGFLAASCGDARGVVLDLSSWRRVVLRALPRGKVQV